VNHAVGSEWAESRFPFYTAEHIQSLYSTSNLSRYRILESDAILIAIAEGKGQLKAGEQSFELSVGSVVLLPPNREAELIADRRHALHAYKLAIGTREQGKSAASNAMMRKSDVASDSSIHFFPYEPAIANEVEELYVHRSPENEARHVRNQIAFHQVLLRVLERQGDKHAAGEQPSVESSVTYLENHYNEKITAEKLAEIAGVSRSHYSILFKQLTGASPNEYLSRLRVNRAKELLIKGSDTLREIALKVGYKDEFYLSRRFKQHTGFPPSAFDRGAIRSVAVWFTPYASHLQLLGLEPAVIVSDNSEYVHADGLQPPQTTRFMNAESSVELLKSVMLERGVELIVAAEQHLRDYGLAVENLRSVAPVAEMSWMDIGWKEHFRFIAQAVGRSDRAERWLSEFEQEEREARMRVRQTPAANEIVTILVVKPESLFVYGARNVGYVTYRSLGLRPPAKIMQEIENLGDRFHSVAIGIPELSEYAGDRVLVIVFPDRKGSTSHSEALFESPYWNELPAVKHDRAHRLDVDEWIPYNPVSVRLQLRRAVALFEGMQ